MKKIAVFSLTPAPPAPVATGKTLEAFERVFPDHQIDVFYVSDWLKRSPWVLPLAALIAIATYLPDLVRRRKKLKHALFRTPWMFRWIGRAVRRHVDPSDYAFAIQLQSLFDASQPGLRNFVYTDHTHLENLNFDDFEPADLYARRWIDCERTVYANAVTTFTWSSNVSRSLVADYGMRASDVECVYAGSNSAMPSRGAADARRYASRNVVFVGSDWTRKGGPTLLAAFATLKARLPDATLTVVGPPPEGPPPEGVRFLGSVPLDRLPAIYASAAVFCMPTRLEPFGNVFVEAMWQSLPIVATRVGALPDLVEDGANGYLVRTGDAAALADRLFALLSDPALCTAFGAEGRRKAEGRYDWTTVAQRIRTRIEADLSHPDPMPGQQPGVAERVTEPALAPA